MHYLVNNNTGKMVISLNPSIRHRALKSWEWLTTTSHQHSYTTMIESFRWILKPWTTLPFFHNILKWPSYKSSNGIWTIQKVRVRNLKLTSWSVYSSPHAVWLRYSRQPAAWFAPVSRIPVFKKFATVCPRCLCLIWKSKKSIG